MTTFDKPHVVVVGGGLAGLACAISCVDAGAQVTLFEARPRLGGATWSFERNGLSFDNGQHVYLRCCHAYRRFLDRIGSAVHAPLQERLALPVLRPRLEGGEPEVSWIKRNAWPAPFHLGVSLLSYGPLGIADRLRLGLAVSALRRLRLSDPSLDDESFEHFLIRHGQSERSIDVLWNLITLPTVNLSARQASLALAAKVFKTGLLEETDAADIGWSRVPLSALHVDPAFDVLKRAGAAVHRRSKVTAIDAGAPAGHVGRTHRVGVVADGEHIGADAVVLAVPHDAAAELLPNESGLDSDTLRSLGHSPIVDVHVVYDRKVTDFEIAAGVDTPVQFVFDKTEASGLDARNGQCLSVSLSAADDEHGLRPEVLIDRYTAALSTLFPRAREAKVLDAVVSREHSATFRGVPGTARSRPGPRTAIEGLFLAGSWCDTGWPATMEGAVRSGVVAGLAALRSVGAERIVPRIPMEVMA